MVFFARRRRSFVMHLYNKLYTVCNKVRVACSSCSKVVGTEGVICEWHEWSVIKLVECKDRIVGLKGSHLCHINAHINPAGIGRYVNPLGSPGGLTVICSGKPEIIIVHCSRGGGCSSQGTGPCCSSIVHRSSIGEIKILNPDGSGTGDVSRETFPDAITRHVGISGSEVPAAEPVVKVISSGVGRKCYCSCVSSLLYTWNRVGRNCAGV